jgi:hypothetical protein
MVTRVTRQAAIATVAIVSRRKKDKERTMLRGEE